MDKTDQGTDTRNHELHRSNFLFLSETFLLRKDVIDSPIYEGIRAIHETSTGLISFVYSYRKFSALQKPSPEPFYLKELLLQVKSIHLIPSHIQLTLQIEPDDLMLYADPNLIRQVLINLLKNATQAIGEKKEKSTFEPIPPRKNIS